MGQPNVHWLPWEKSNFEKWKKFDIILEANNFMTYESCEEKKTVPCREKSKEKRNEREGGKTLLLQSEQTLYGGNQPHRLVADKGIHCWGSREQPWMKLIWED